MKTLCLLAGIIAFSALTPGVVLSSPPYPLESLLERAEHVYIVRLSSHTSSNATFEVTEVLRGDTLKSIALSYSPYDNPLPKSTTEFLLFSQGGGEPPPTLSIGQPIKGQAGYHGWILWRSPIDSDAERERLRKLAKEGSYKYGKSPTTR